MLQKLKALWDVFQLGKEVSSPAKWKMHQVSANAIAAFLFALFQLAKVCGYDLGIDMQSCADIAIGLLAITNIGITVATSKTVGIKSLPEASVRETIQAVPSDEPAAENAETLPHISEAFVGQRTISTIDDDTRRRAVEWARGHSTENRFQNDA